MCKYNLKMKNLFNRAITVLLIFSLALSCSPSRKMRNLSKENVNATLSLSSSYESDLPELHIDKARRDTFEVLGDEGEKILIMNAVRDDATGEMVATDVIQAAVVTARFRNIAERHGRIDIRFQITVPPSMQDSRWQVRFNPDMFVQDDSIRLDPVIITGKAYRERQLKGYERYNRFLASIITDSTAFIDSRALEIFIKRNIPEMYALKTDSTVVSDERYRSIYGVSAREAIDHYTNRFRLRQNEKKISRKDRMFSRYVKTPLVTEGIRLDTVMVSSGGEFTYEYVQTINTRPKLSKVLVKLSGGIYEEDRNIYSIPQSEPLTFYVSSISSFLDPSERYMTKVIERRATANTACYIAFLPGRSDIDERFSGNREEMSRIRRNLSSLIENREFDLDSIIVTASCSPEGSFKLNSRLAGDRSSSVSDYFRKYIRHCRDSLRRSEGLSYNLDETYAEEPARKKIRLVPRSNPENWDYLKTLVSADSVMTVGEKEDFSKRLSVKDPDERERQMAFQPYYRRLREVLYPKLRTVRFDFYLHRKGMVKDTVHTTVLDTAYMRGVMALADRDYETAVTLLRPYKDFNAAVALTAMDYNLSAMEILRTLPVSDRTEYLSAILYSRQGDDKEAVQHYLNAVRMNRSYVYRGNLDPEISVLIKKYKLNNDE